MDKSISVDDLYDNIQEHYKDIEEINLDPKNPISRELFEYSLFGADKLDSDN